MKIYSIKEIVEATNNILNTDVKKKPKEQIKEKKIENKTEVFETPLVLNNEISTIPKKEKNYVNHKIELKSYVKDKIVSELYVFLKKKVKKNTLKIIIDEQVEIRNLKNKIDSLNSNKDKLLDDYKNLEKKYDFLLENNELLKNENQKIIKNNNQLKLNNNELSHLINIANNKNKDLILENSELTNNNKELQNNLSIISGENSQLSTEVKDLKSELTDKDLYLENTNQKNRSFEINNAELKNTVSRYVINLKKLQEQLDAADKSKNNELNEINQKVKFYQDENIRLSGELLLYQKKNENIKINLADIKSEKEMISNKIKELGKSIEEKANIVETKFSNENHVVQTKDLEKLNDKEQKSLDEVISKIFQKI